MDQLIRRPNQRFQEDLNLKQDTRQRDMQRPQVQAMKMFMHAGRRMDAMDCQLHKKKEDPDRRRRDQAGS